jgi:hypothetical protein
VSVRGVGDRPAFGTAGGGLRGVSVRVVGDRPVVGTAGGRCPGVPIREWGLRGVSVQGVGDRPVVGTAGGRCPCVPIRGVEIAPRVGTGNRRSAGRVGAGRGPRRRAGVSRPYDWLASASRRGKSPGPNPTWAGARLHRAWSRGRVPGWSAGCPYPATPPWWTGPVSRQGGLVR